MKAGGNLVLIGHRATVWETKTSGHRGARLVVQDDGNLVVYGADSSILWQSETVTEWAAATGDRLRATEALFPGASLTAKTRPLTLTLQADGDLVLAREDVPVWASGTAGKAVTSAVMQEDGNLVLHGPQGTVWASQTGGTPGAKLILQDDGNAAIVGKQGRSPWTTRTPLWPPAGRTDVLWPLDALGPKDRLRSPSGQFQLVLQTDGNLVLYDGQTAIWATGTSGQTASQAAMQADGNLVLVGPGGAVVWEARTAGHPGARLVLQDDGNAVVYALDKRPLWSTGTAERRRDIGLAMQDAALAELVLVGGLDEREPLLQPGQRVDAVHARERRARADRVLRRRLDAAVQQGLVPRSRPDADRQPSELGREPRRPERRRA